MCSEKLNPARCLLLAIDLQQRLMEAVAEGETVVEKSLLMLRAAGLFGIPVLATTQYAKGLGGLVPQVEELVGAGRALDKVEFDCFANPAIRAAVERMPVAVDTVIILGVESHICVYQTALGAVRLGLRPWIVSDAVSSRDRGNHEAALARFSSLGIAWGPAEMVVYQFMGRAGTREFKALLPHIK